MGETKTYTRIVTATSGGETCTGEVAGVEFGSRERARRAVFTAFKLLGCTLGCLLIPGAHFVLVPLGLLLVPVLSIKAWRVQTKVISANITCPKCNGAVPVLSAQERYPLYETCAVCHREVAISPVE